MFKFNCLEGVVAAGIAGATIVGGHFDPGIAVGGVIGLTAILARFRENAAERGLDDNRLVDRMRLAAIRDLDRFDDTDAIRAARVDADNRMAELLPKITITRGLLARSSMQSAGHPFPDYAAMRIADELAVHEPLFARPATGAPLSEHRRFALHVVTRAIEVAMEETDFVVRLTADLVIEGNRKLAEMDAKLDGQAADTAEIKAIVAATAEEGRARNVSEETLLALARLIVPGVPDVGTAILELQRALMLFVEQRDRAEPGTNHSDWLSETFRRIAELNSQNKFAEGAAEGERAYEEAIERQNAERLSLIEFNIGQNLLARDADGAARWIERQVQNEHGTVSATLLFEPIIHFRDEAQARGTRLGLDIAIHLSKRAIEIAASDLESGHAWDLFGTVLTTDGHWDVGESAIAKLKRAADAFCNAISFKNKTGLNDQLAFTHNNLGIVLKLIGERLDGEAGLRFFKEAIMATEVSLQYFDKSLSPNFWAVLQHNLGNALAREGEYSGGEQGVRLLRMAISAYRSALEVRTKTEHPSEWAMTTTSLGLAFYVLGQRLGPLEAPQMLIEASLLFGSALGIQSTVSPVAWATTRFNFGLCQKALAERSVDPLSNWREAEQAVRDALRVYTPEHMRYDFGKATELLDEILAEIAKLGG